MKYILVEGELISENKEIFTANDLEHYHTSVTCNIRIEEEKLLFPELHWLKTLQLCNILCCQKPKTFNTSTNFTTELSRLIERNEISMGFIHLRILQSGKYIAKSTKLHRSIFEFPIVGERMSHKTFYSELALPDWFRLKTLWPAELQHSETNGFSNLFVKNGYDFEIKESLIGCFFVVHETQIFLTGYKVETANCLTTEFLHYNNQLGFAIQQRDSISEQILLESDEIFWFNDTLGIQWAISYANRRFYNKTSREIYFRFTKLLQQ